MVERMKAAGGIMLGKTNTPTFGWIGATHNLALRDHAQSLEPRAHPGRLERRRLGGRGGRAGPAAHRHRRRRLDPHPGRRAPGSSASSPRTGASRRIRPAARWSLSHVGPMTRTVADAALMLTVCAGPDERDQYSLPGRARGLREGAAREPQGLRVAYTRRPRLRRRGRSRGARRPARRRRARSASSAAASRKSSRAWPSPREAWGELFCGGIATRMAPYLDRRARDRARSATGSSRATLQELRRRSTCRRGSIGSRGGSTRARSSRSTICC